MVTLSQGGDHEEYSHWSVTPCSLGRAQHFGGTYHFHFQDQRVCHVRNQQKRETHCRLLSLLLDPDDGRNIFLQSTGPSLKYVVLQLKDHTPQYLFEVVTY
jgi:hypothetical protein